MAFRLSPVGVHGPEALHVRGHFVKPIPSVVPRGNPDGRQGLGRIEQETDL